MNYGVLYEETQLQLWVSSCVYLYGVGLVVLDSLSTPHSPGEGKFRGGWVFISFLWSISSSTWALLSSHRLIRLDLHPSLWIPLRVFRRLLFLLLLLFLLGVRVSFSLAVLSQLEGKEENRKCEKKYNLHFLLFLKVKKKALRNTFCKTSVKMLVLISARSFHSDLCLSEPDAQT